MNIEVQVSSWVECPIKKLQGVRARNEGARAGLKGTKADGIRKNERGDD